MARRPATAGAERAGNLRLFAPAVYFAGALLVVVPLGDFLLNAWPPQPGDIRWRYGALGLLAQFLHTPLLALLLVGLYAHVLGHRAPLIIVTWISFLAAAAGALSIVTFSLDSLQMRAAVAPEAREMFGISVGRALVKHLLTAIAFLLLGLGARRAARSWRDASGGGRRAGSKAAKPLITAPRDREPTQAG